MCQGLEAGPGMWWALRELVLLARLCGDKGLRQEGLLKTPQGTAGRT